MFFCFRSWSLVGWRIKDDVSGVSIQETGQKRRPARMVGLSSLESAVTGKDAGPLLRNPRMRKRRKR